MPKIFSIASSGDFMQMLEANFADFQKEPGSSRLFLNCAITAYHLHEWVWGDWLKKDVATKSALGVKTSGEFKDWIDAHCVWFSFVRELTNGTKHFGSPTFAASRVGAPPFMLDVDGAGLDEGSWDGPDPFETGEREYLLIDAGPAALESQYLMAGQVLHAVVQFWRDFFRIYGAASHLLAGDNISGGRPTAL